MKQETEELYTHWFDLGSVQFSPVEHDSMDGITCPGRLDGGREHVQEVLEKREINSNKSMTSHISFNILYCPGQKGENANRQAP